MVLVEVGGRFSKTTPLNTVQNCWCLGIGFLSIIWGFILKFTGFEIWDTISGCISLDVDEDDLKKAEEVDENGEPANQSSASFFKKSMAKSAGQRKREKEIREKVDNAIRDAMQAKMKRKMSNLKGIN